MAEEGEAVVDLELDETAEDMQMDEELVTLQQEREKHKQRWVKCLHDALVSMFRGWPLPVQSLRRLTGLQSASAHQ